MITDLYMQYHTTVYALNEMSFYRSAMNWKLYFLKISL